MCMNLTLAINSKVEDAKLMYLNNDQEWQRLPIHPDVLDRIQATRLSVLLNSPGGQCVAGEKIIKLIDAAQTHGPVDAYATRAESAASDIFLRADADKRYFLSNGRFMMHPTSYDTSPPLSRVHLSAVDFAFHRHQKGVKNAQAIDELKKHLKELISNSRSEDRYKLREQMLRQIEREGTETELRLSGSELHRWVITQEAPETIDELWALFTQNTGLTKEAIKKSEDLRAFWGDNLDDFDDLIRASTEIKTKQFLLGIGRFMRWAF